MRKPKYTPMEDNLYKTTVTLADLGLEVRYNPEADFQKHYTLLMNGEVVMADINQGNTVELIGKRWLGVPMNLTPSGLVDIAGLNVEIKGSEFSIAEDRQGTGKTDGIKYYLSKTPATRHLMIVFNDDYTKVFIYDMMKSIFEIFIYQGNKNKGAVRYTNGKLRGRRQTERTLDEFIRWLIDYKAGLVKRERRHK